MLFQRVSQPFAHQLVGAVAHTENVQKPARFEFLSLGGAAPSAAPD
jgi:hypothetical protein